MQSLKPTSVAQSDASQTDDQETADWIPSGNIFWQKLIMKYFLRSLSLYHRFKKGGCQLIAKEYAQVLVNCLED